MRSVLRRAMTLEPSAALFVRPWAELDPRAILLHFVAGAALDRYGTAAMGFRDRDDARESR